MTLCYAFLGVNAIVLTVFSEDRKNLDIGIVFFMLSISFVYGNGKETLRR